MIILESGDRLFAHSRDISTGGIGLSHSRALPLGPLKMNVDMGGEGYMHIRATIVWCRRICDKSYISGGEFLAPPAMHAPAWSDEQVVRGADGLP
jgi:PilZ domain